MALYSCPTAHIWVNGLLSHPVHISNGTHEGCQDVLSHQFSTYEAMEHLAMALHANNADY